MREVKERLQNWNRERLVKEGYALFTMKAKRAGMLFDDFLIKFTPQAGGSLPYHRFAHGDMAVMTCMATNQRTFEGTIVERSPNFLLMACKDISQELTETVWVRRRIKVYSNDRH